MVHEDQAKESSPPALCVGAQPAQQTLSSSPPQPSLLSISIYFVFLFIRLYIRLPPLPACQILLSLHT